jgi:hypothetical protein
MTLIKRILSSGNSSFNNGVAANASLIGMSEIRHAQISF